MRPDLEQAFIKKYVVKSKRDRYLGFIAKDKTRGGFLGMLYHGQDLDKSLLQELRGNASQVLEAVRNKAKAITNGDRCYVISMNKEWDRKELLTSEAIDGIVNHVEATLLVFGNGTGFYYEGEPPYNCYLSL